jgi:hypothetical protein
MPPGAAQRKPFAGARRPFAGTVEIAAPPGRGFMNRRPRLLDRRTELGLMCVAFAKAKSGREADRC